MKITAALVAIAALALAGCGDPTLAGPARAPDRLVAALAPHDSQVVMRGLNNPRGLAFGPDGALFVAEAGRGGTGPCFVVGQEVCYGPTGAVGRLWRGTQDTVVSGLPSYANSGGRAEGPNAVALLGMGGAYVTVGLEHDPRDRDGIPELAGFASLVHVSPLALLPRQSPALSSTAWEYVADLGSYEVIANPDCGRIDSNPFALVVAPGGVVVADAGGNALVRVGANGDLSTFAAFPSRYTTPQGPECPALPADYPATLPKETVPTSIAIGPDGAYYVSHLAGFPVVVGGANVYRVVRGRAPEVYLAGFTFVIALAFDAQENLYVLQHLDKPGMPATGSLIRVATDGSRTTVIAGLVRPTGLAIGPDGAIYISHRGTAVGTGEVLRLGPDT